MKAKFSYVLIFILSAHLLACSGGEDANVSVVVGSSPYALIPAKATSCVASKNADATTPADPDIEPSYFKIPTITFNRKDATNIFMVAVIRVKINVPGSEAPISCEAGGDDLAALSSTWWGSSTKETIIAAGATSFPTDCALYCGGVKVGDTPFTATGTLEVFGYERNPTSLEEVPVKIQTSISIQNY